MSTARLMEFLPKTAAFEMRQTRPCTNRTGLNIVISAKFEEFVEAGYLRGNREPEAKAEVPD